MLTWFVIAIICALVAAAMGRPKGLAPSGFFYGLVLGPLGVAIVYFWKGDRVECPECKELILPLQG